MVLWKIFLKVYCFISLMLLSVFYLTKEVNPSLTEPPLKFCGGLTKFCLIS